MSVLDILSAARDLGRLHEIASVLVRHGLGSLVRATGLGHWLERAGRALHWEAPQHVGQRSTAEHARAALEELGPTFVKSGQLLASRADVVPEDFVRELARLQEHVEPVPWPALAAQIEQDLGAAPEAVWSHVDHSPLAAGSIAQVHRATLADGTAVVLKVRRPGIHNVVEADLRLLARLAEVVESEVPDLRHYRPRKLVRAFARTMRDELDLAVEARNTEQLARQLAGHAGVVLPRVHPAWTSERLVVLDHLPGPSVASWLSNPAAATVDGPALARIGADALLTMVFVDGFFHADPHAGNLLLLPDGRLGLIDCGMVGRLSDARRGEFIALLAGALRRDERGVVDVLVDWTERDDEVDFDQLSADARALVDRYHGLPLDRLHMPAVLGDVLDLVRENGLFLPSDVASLLRVLLLLDGLGRALDPDFNLTLHLQPFVERLVRNRHSWRRALVRQAREVAALVSDAPRDLREILSKARRGRFRLDLELRRLDDFATRLDRSANRLTMGLVTSALIVGTSVTLTVDGGPRLFGMPTFALLGFVSSALLGLAVLVAIWRSTRR
ncbi:MAG TPA: AarF/UbiB family protein [Planctomycetota bacterium]|nr:AarF/UbiB family protein [Planctomycetota bacterium]